MGIDTLVLGADALVFRQWHHGGELLDDAEIEMGVSYELFTCDLANDGGLERFQSSAPACQAKEFFEYIAPRANQKLQDETCLDEIPREDWILVYMRYHASLLLAFDGCDHVVTDAARECLAFAMLSCLDGYQRPV